jgi:outer membrane protein assembly factor BamB
LVAVVAVAVFGAAALTGAVPAMATGILSMTSFSPGSGPVGTTVTIQGTGFVASDVVRFNGRQAHVGSVNAAGTQLTTTVPAMATSGIITVMDPTTGQVAELPNDPFKVTLGMFASPRAVWAGSHLTVAGSGLPPGGEGRLTIGSTFVSQAVFDSNGNFQIGVSVPWSELSGKVLLTLLYNSSRLVDIMFILGDWPMYRHDAAHTGDDTYEPALTKAKVPSLKELWELSTPANTSFTLPSVAGGQLMYGEDYPPNDDSSLWAWPPDAKSFTWVDDYSGNSITTEPAVGDGNAYFTAGAGLGPTYASVSATTGSKNWTYGAAAVHGGVTSPPTLGPSGALLFGSPDGTLYAMNGTNGAKLWSYPTGAPIVSSPAVANGLVYFGSTAGSFYALYATTGKLAWAVTGYAPISSSPAVVGNTVFFGAGDKVVALNATNGGGGWTDTFAGQTYNTSPAVAGGVVYIGGGTSTTGYVRALSASSGAGLWSITTSPGVTDPAYANSVLYYGTSSGVAAADASSGVPLWSSSLPKNTRGPVVSDGAVYVTAANGLFAFGL